MPAVRIKAESFDFWWPLRGINCSIYSEGNVQLGDESVEASGDNYSARIRSRRDLCLKGGSLSAQEQHSARAEALKMCWLGDWYHRTFYSISEGGALTKTSHFK